MKCLIWRHKFYINKVDPKQIKQFFYNLLQQAGFGIVKFVGTPLRDGNYLGVFVIEESHFDFYVRAEEGMTYCEVSSCNSKKFCTFIESVESITISTTKAQTWFHQLTLDRTEPVRLKEDIEKAIQVAGLRVMAFAEHYFQGGGVTWVFIFEDGVVHFHSFPEDEKTDCEITFFYRSGYILITGLLEEQLR